MRDGQAGLGHPPWWGGGWPREVCNEGGGVFLRDMNAPRLDASAN